MNELTSSTSIVSQPRLAVLIPCLNEALTIAKVVRDFKQVLPQAQIYVYDNGSTDNTGAVAESAGASVQIDYHRGKGNVVRRMFRDIDADIYIMVDGDDTYEAKDVLALLEPVQAGRADMVTGNRLNVTARANINWLHYWGNRLFAVVLNSLFHSHTTDILSGFRVMNRAFVKGVSLISCGFEIETELTIQALEFNFLLVERPIAYRARPSGSFSKIRTYTDGWRILMTIFLIFRDYRPMRFFGAIAFVCWVIGLVAGFRVITEYLATGLVLHFPTAIFSVGAVIIGALFIMTGLLMDTFSRRFAELRERLH